MRSSQLLHRVGIYISGGPAYRKFGLQYPHNVESFSVDGDERPDIC